MIRTNDKRRAQRDKHDSVVEILRPDGKLKATGRLADYSASGISFTSDAAFAKGDRFSARLRLLDKGVLEVTGEVVWVRKEGARVLYGVRFESVNRVHPTGEFKGEK
jgi:hypothetical protein